VVGARWAEQHNVAGLGEERSGRARDNLLADGGLVVPVEIVEGLVGGEPGPTDALRGAGRVACGDLAFEHCGEVVLVCPAGVACLVSEPMCGLDDAGRFQRGGQVVDLFDGVGRSGLLLGGHQATCPSRSIPNARS
jgi:hypothetical protein